MNIRQKVAAYNPLYGPSLESDKSYRVKSSRKGSRRIDIDRHEAFGTTEVARYYISVRDAKTGDAVSTTFWTKNLVGKNSRDLAVGSDVEFVVEYVGFASKVVRAWTHGRALKFYWKKVDETDRVGRYM